MYLSEDHTVRLLGYSHIRQSEDRAKRLHLLFALPREVPNSLAAQGEAESTMGYFYLQTWGKSAQRASNAQQSYVEFTRLEGFG